MKPFELFLIWISIYNSKRTMSTFKRGIIKSVLVISYFPLSFCLIGLLAYQMRCPSPIERSYQFKDVFLYYANPLNIKFIGMHFPTLLFSFAFLFLLVTYSSTSKPLITLTQIRIILLILITIVTIFVHIFYQSVLWSNDVPLFAQEYVFMDLFLYVDVDLILLYLLSYIPIFWNLKPAPMKLKQIKLNLGKTISIKETTPSNIR